MKFRIENRHCYLVPDSITQKEEIADNALEIEFEFDAEWAGITKTARFSKGWEGAYIDALIENGKCRVTLEYGDWYVGVFSADMCTTPCKSTIGISELSFNGNPADPSESIYQMILQKLDTITGADPELIAEAIAAYLAEHPIEGITEADVQSIIAAYLAENPQGVDAEAVNALIAGYLAEHPQGVDEAAVNALIASYISEHPVDTLTEADVQAIVSAYLADHPAGVDAETVNALIASYIAAHPQGSGISEEECRRIIAATIAGKADKTDIPSLDGYATESWVEGKNYITEHQQLKTINGQSIIGTGNIEFSGSASPSEIASAVNNYFNENPLDAVTHTELREFNHDNLGEFTINYKASTYSLSYPYVLLFKLRPIEYTNPCAVFFRIESDVHEHPEANWVHDCMMTYAVNTTDGYIGNSSYEFTNYGFSTAYRDFYILTTQLPKVMSGKTEYMIPVCIKIDGTAYGYNQFDRDFKVVVTRVENATVEMSNEHVGKNSAQTAFPESTSAYYGWQDRAQVSTIGNVHTGDADTYNRTQVALSAVVADFPLYRYKVCAETLEGRIAPLATNNKEGTGNALCVPNVTSKFRLGCAFYYYNSTTNVPVGSAVQNWTLFNCYQSGVDARFWLSASNSKIMIQGQALTGTNASTINKPLYLIALDNGDGTFSLDASLSTTDISYHLATELPAEDDGHIYIKVGAIATTQTQFVLNASHPIYRWDGRAYSAYAVNVSDGEDGYSPTVTTTAISGGTKVTITDKNGNHEFNVMNGTNGSGGGSTTTYPLPLTVATFNVAGYNNSGYYGSGTDEQIIDYMRILSDADADVLAVQEDKPYYNSTTKSNDVIYNKFYQYKYDTSGSGVTSIKSRYQLANTSTTRFSIDSTHMYAEGTITVNGIDIKVISVHTSFQPSSYVESCHRELLAYLATLDNFILMGDFNPWGDDHHYWDTVYGNYTRAGYNVASCGVWDKVLTCQGNGSYDYIWVPCDNIVTSPNIKITKVYAVDNTISDHKMLVAKLLVTTDNTQTPSLPVVVTPSETTYTLTFNVDGGSAISPVTLAEGSVVTLSSYTTTKSGYTFDGWYSDSSKTNAITSVTLNANTTVYAKWTETSGGGGSSDEPEELSVMDLAGIKLASTELQSKGSSIHTYRVKIDPDAQYNITTINTPSGISVGFNSTGGTTAGTPISNYKGVGTGTLTNFPFVHPEGMTYAYLYNNSSGAAFEFTITKL